MSRYDSRTTTFTSEGRLLQVEYAIEGINRAPMALAVVTRTGVVFATERRPKGPLVASENPAIKDINGEKVYMIDQHIGAAVAGLTSDASVLIEQARYRAQQHRYTFGEPMPCEDMAQTLSDIKHGYTTYGSNRPFGVAFLLGSWDRFFGFQLYHTDPSGNFSSWRAYAIGQNEGPAMAMLKQDWNENLDLEGGILLALKIMAKTLDAVSLKPELVEVAVLSRAPRSQPVFHILTDAELVPKIEAAEVLRRREDEERETRRRERAAQQDAAVAGTGAAAAQP